MAGLAGKFLSQTSTIVTKNRKAGRLVNLVPSSVAKHHARLRVRAGDADDCREQRASLSAEDYNCARRILPWLQSCDSSVLGHDADG